MSTELLIERGKTHGDFKQQFDTAQKLKEILYHNSRHDFEASTQGRIMQEALQSIALKMSRIVTGDPMCIDHWRDIAGYATLVAEMLEGKTQCAQ